MAELVFHDELFVQGKESTYFHSRGCRLRNMASTAKVVRQVLRHCKEHPSHAALGLLLLLLLLRLAHTCVLSDAFQTVWWNSWHLRESVKYCITAQIAYAISCYLRDAVKVGFTICRECLCMCRRRPAAERLRSSLGDRQRRSVQWNDNSVWIPDANFDNHSVSSRVQRDASGVTWRRVMGGDRATVPVFNFEDTPPHSRHPTPSVETSAVGCR